MKLINIQFNKKNLSNEITKQSLNWAINYLKKKIKKSNYIEQTQSTLNTIECIIIDNSSPIIDKYKKLVEFNNKKESFLIYPLSLKYNKIIIYGADLRGLIYAITEIADRVENLITSKNILQEIFFKTIESPKTKIRSISKCFESDIEDLPWYHNKTMWKEYLDMLVINRFNRFTFTLGMQYNYPYGNEFIKDVYFYLAYPFLVKPKGYKMYAEGINKKTRDNNLKILKFISDEASLRGLDFQLALWTQRYDFDEVPNANYQIKNIPNNYAEYCRDSLEVILKKCTNINGITLRVHVECGIQERDYKFWKIYFESIKKIKRKINLDLHAKGIDNKLINLALNATSDVTVSPKYTAEHMGLPYHQTSIRKQELPPKKQVDKKWIFSEGKRKFLRYSYGDLLSNNRKFDILFRIWPGTQRILIWGDSDLARGYGQHSTFCNSLGVELCEPLSFKGRMGTGIKNGRFNYSVKQLRTKYDWQKYLFTYKIWGRCTYNYETIENNYSRYYKKLFGKSSNELIKSLSYASKILPFFTLVHGVSASNNSYWPEMYENMSIVENAPHLPYSYDLHKPSRFGMATSQDPNLIMSPLELANCIYNKKNIKKYSPITMANWFNEYANKARTNLLKAIKTIKNKNDPEFLRLEIDISILIGIGKFFSYKIKSACYWELYIKEKKFNLGYQSLQLYKKSYSAWSKIAKISKKFYLEDLTYGPQSWLRGRWDDRLPAIKDDIVKMTNILDGNLIKSKKHINIFELSKWNNNQSFYINHTIEKKSDRSVDITINNLNKINGELFFNYRQVNQAKKWQRNKIRSLKNRFTIMKFNNFLKQNYPIQYYFELVEKKYSYFCPGINKNLSNQPYYVYDNI